MIAVIINFLTKLPIRLRVISETLLLFFSDYSKCQFRCSTEKIS